MRPNNNVTVRSRLFSLQQKQEQTQAALMEEGERIEMGTRIVHPVAAYEAGCPVFPRNKLEESTAAVERIENYEIEGRR
ncbi:unnamed protein product [Hydatigera taeniaeformis]|uniref:DUF3343 domain-containing protein n=1 Tax=Hydatigena taeniaeformis TaxID=6205 RepID=A0A0R3WRP4_HYDTA|nr:unnamed protein product [Hydatigera taeniaeformis]